MFLTSLFYQLQYQSHRKKQYSLILLDPHGDLATEVLKFRLNRLKPERVLYIDPVWETDTIPCINPFWQRVTDPVMIDVMASQFAKTFSELISEVGLSLQMETLLKPCLSVLFEKGGCGISDLQAFMDDSQNHKWVELGKASNFSVYRQFFSNAFQNKKYAATKLAIYTRLQHLQNNNRFYYMMNGASTLNFKSEMNQGKVILINLSKGKLGDATSRAIGKFIIASLLSIALQRAYEHQNLRKPTYVFIDEFHNFASQSMETVFSEMRKYKLHFVVATQSLNQLPTALKDMVLNNTAIKLVGINGLPALKTQAGDLGVSYAAMQTLNPFEFYLKYDHYKAKKIQSPNFLIQKRSWYYMSHQQMMALKQKVLLENSVYKSIKSQTSNIAAAEDGNIEIYTPKFEL